MYGPCEDSSVRMYARAHESDTSARWTAELKEVRS